MNWFWQYLRNKMQLSGEGYSWRNPWSWMYIGSDTAAGKSVGPETAMQVASVMACVRVLSETMACFPLKIYERTGDGKKREAGEYPLSYVLRYQPNPWQTPFEWIEMMQAHLCLRGNAYSVIEPGSLGAATRLVPIHPDLVKVERLKSNGNLIYKYRDANNVEQTKTQSEMFHLRGLSFDGMTGVSVIRYAKEAVGLALASEEYGASLFKNGAVPKMLLSTDQPLKKEERDQMGEKWTEKYGGSGNHNKTAVLSHGLKAQQLSINPEDSQFLQTRQYQTQEIARIFRVPLHLIGDLSRATFSNIEQQSLEFVTYTMLPWCRRWEAAINSSLIAETNGKYFAEFTVEGLLRADATARATLYRELFNVGVYSVNDILSKENENGIGPEGDKRFVNAALVDLTKAGDPQRGQPQPPESGATAPKKKPGTSGKLAKARSAAVLAIQSKVESLIRWEAAETSRIAAKSEGFLQRLEEFHKSHAERFSSGLSQSVGVIEAIDERTIDSKSLTEDHFKKSIEMILSASECKAEELSVKVAELVSNWERDRTNEVLKCLGL